MESCKLMFSFWFQLFHSHLIGPWLKGLFTCAHLNTRHLWKSKQRYQSMPFTSIPLLAEITLKTGSWMLQVFSGRHHISSCTCYSLFQVELRASSSHCLVLISFSVFSFFVSVFIQVLSINSCSHFESHALKTFSLPSKWSICRCFGNIWMDKMFLHNLQQCQRLRACKIGYFAWRGMVGVVNIQTSPLFQARCLKFRMLGCPALNVA